MYLLTEKQLEVARGIVQGDTYAQIAVRLGVRTDTVKSHAEEIYLRLAINKGNGAIQLTRLYAAQLQKKMDTSLEGYWLSRFEYKSRSLSSAGDSEITGIQINLEHLTVENNSFFTHTGSSLCSSPSTKLAFSHDLKLKQIGQIAVGIWQNSNTNNIGCMQFSIRNDYLGMQGMHLGNKSDLSVSFGSWIWRRVHATHLEVVEQGAPNFKSIDELQSLFAADVDPRQRIKLSDVFQHAKKPSF